MGCKAATESLRADLFVETRQVRGGFHCSLQPTRIEMVAAGNAVARVDGQANGMRAYNICIDPCR